MPLVLRPLAFVIGLGLLVTAAAVCFVQGASIRSMADGAAPWARLLLGMAAACFAAAGATGLAADLSQLSAGP